MTTYFVTRRDGDRVVKNVGVKDKEKQRKSANPLDRQHKTGIEGHSHQPSSLNKEEESYQPHRPTTGH
ncbi:jg7121, partial [Pararge aegeria aegeria]